MARRAALAAAAAVALLAVSGAGGASAQTPKRGGTLVIGTRPASEPACLNVVTCELGVTLLGFLGEVLPGAYEVLPNGTFRPNLARAAIVSKQPFTVIYRIRSEARWSDGVPVTAADFAFTDRVRRAHLPDDLHRTYVRTVRRLDARTVRVVLRAPFADWRFLFDVVLPRHALAGRAFGSVWRNDMNDPKTAKPIGSGPFVLDGWVRGKQLTFRRNPRYWGRHPAHLGRIVIRFLPVEDIEPALRRGDIDMIDPAPATLGAAAAEFHRRPAPGIRALPALSAAYEHVAIRLGEGGHPALGRSRLVRQALAYGIDRAAIARTIGRLSGARTAALQPADSAVYLPNSPYYRPNWKDYRYQRARARRLLEQAGCRTGTDGIYICADDRLSLRFVTAAGVERRERTVKLVQAQLRQVGVEVRPVFAPPQTFFSQILPSGDFDLALFGWIVGAATTWDAVFGCSRPSNLMGYCDRLVTRDLVQATRILDDGRRVGLVNRIDARLAKAVPLIPLYQVSGFFAFKTTVRGVVPNGPGSFAWNSENWWLAQPR